jgi:hypothetical protein
MTKAGKQEKKLMDLIPVFLLSSLFWAFLVTRVEGEPLA